MPAPKGNRFWEARSKHGRDKIFSTPEILWDAAVEYFEWVEENPLYEQKAWCHQGEVITEDMPKMRAMTFGGLCIFLDVDKKTWDMYKAREDFIPITNRISEVIRDQKFSGAAADLLNASIIARDLGLKDQTSNEHTGKNGGPQEHKWTIEIIEPD